MSDDTEFVQGFLDRAEPIPAGDYTCPHGVEIPGAYWDRAVAGGREPGPGGFYLSDGEATIRFAGNGYVTIGAARVTGPSDLDVMAQIGVNGTALTGRPRTSG